MDLRYAAHAASLRFSYGRASRGTPEATEAAVPAAPSLSISAERRQSNRRLAEVAARLGEGRQKRLDLLERVAQGKIRASEAGAILPHGRYVAEPEGA
jgi:hypothetical protein